MDFMAKIKSLFDGKKKEDGQTYNEQVGWDSEKGEYKKDSPWMMMGSTDMRKRVSAGFKKAK